MPIPSNPRLRAAVAVTSAWVVLAPLCGCTLVPPEEEPAEPAADVTFREITAHLETHADALVFSERRPTDGPTAAVLVSPHLQGRIVTLKVGDVESTGFVNAPAIAEGDVNPQFNNFGGVDRFWLGPEAGQFGLYFPPGAELNRDTWDVPKSFDRGPFRIVSQERNKVHLARDMQVRNYLGHDFSVRIEREVGLLSARALRRELGIDLPRGVEYSGAYSWNLLTNAGDRQWDPETGLVGIWILGQFAASDWAVVIAPFRAGGAEELGPAFNDDYFGKVSEDTPDRLKVVGDAVLFRGDARRVGKFGISQRRTLGIAGSIDFEKELLTVVKFDVPNEPERYGNSQWVKVQETPYGGDLFQSYNNGDPTHAGKRAADAFYELESTSPVRPLRPGESVQHRHATHHFQGDLAGLRSLAQEVLGVDLDEVRRTMFE